MSGKDKKLDAKTLVALALIDQAFWAEALRIVERRIEEEDRRRKQTPTQRVKLLRPVHVPVDLETCAPPTNCIETRC